MQDLEPVEKAPEQPAPLAAEAAPVEAAPEAPKAEDPKLGIGDLTDVIDLCLALLSAGVGALQDGKVDLLDLFQLTKVVPAVGPAVAGIQNVPSELADLNEEEAAALIKHVMEKLSVGDEKARLVVDKALKVSASAWELVRAVRS